MPRELPLTPETEDLVTRWLQTWKTPDLATRARIEFSPWLTLTRCYPDRRLIRIAAYVAQSEEGNGLLHDVLCHELAHLAARELHGGRIPLRTRSGARVGKVRPHGAGWKALVRAAGYEPKTRLPAPPGAPRPARAETDATASSTSTAAPSVSSTAPPGASRFPFGHRARSSRRSARKTV